MNFDDILEILAKADPYSSSPHSAYEVKGTAGKSKIGGAIDAVKNKFSSGTTTYEEPKESSPNPYGTTSERQKVEDAQAPNKDSQAPEAAQTPNNSMGGGGDEGGGEEEKEPGLFSSGTKGKWMDIASQGSGGEGGGGEADAAQNRAQMRRQGASTSRLQRQAQLPQRTQKSFNPALASLLAVAAGYASSDAFISGAGGRTNKDITAGQIENFNRMSRNQTKARQQTKKNRATTSRVKNIRLAYKEVSDDEHVAKLETVVNPDGKKGMAAARAEIEAMREAKRVEKAHAPVPPIQGLVWDQSVKKWRKPENVGKTATEVQGKKRFRGSGIGQTGGSVGGTASGKGRTKGSAGGRKGRVAVGDIGVAGKSRRYSAKKKRIRRK
tara:strand:+ start:1524 stop:2669 length:1146 start_codon:yes stop_codon:yes gene_type:complete